MCKKQLFVLEKLYKDLEMPMDENFYILKRFSNQ